MAALALLGRVTAGRFRFPSTRVVTRQPAGRGRAPGAAHVMIYLHDVQQIAFIPL
jgi:hypothetical protein